MGWTDENCPSLNANVDSVQPHYRPPDQKHEFECPLFVLEASCTRSPASFSTMATSYRCRRFDWRRTWAALAEAEAVSFPGNVTVAYGR